MEASLDYFKRWLHAQRREGIDKPSLVAFVILLAWFLGNVASPFLAPPGTIDFGNDGLVGARDKADEISHIDSSFARFFYNAGDANCHQRAERSFFLNDNQMPFCARCTSIFFGLMVGVFIMMFLALELNIFWILLGLVPMAIDGGLQLVDSVNYESTNLLRFLTGSLAGIVTGIALGYLVSEMSRIVVQGRRLKKGSR